MNIDAGTNTAISEKDAVIFEQRPPLRSLDDDERLAHLGARTSGVLATVNAVGYPHLSTVIFAWDPDARLIRVSTRAQRAKAKNAARNPHAALFVEGPDKWSFVVAEGDVEVSPISTEPGDATSRELLAIFPQPDAAAEAAFLAEQVAEQRVVMRLHATRLYGDIIETTPPR
jgi:PPOX class probable F420-dependent enzyme